MYFYFTDHLGSTTYITDREEVSQYVAYTPYGETFKEYRNVTPYKFNGKELDQETGYYYYGARYYDPGTALWFGVDPLAGKYPMNSPYVYCNGNSIRYVDPDGNNPLDPRTGKEYSFGLFGLYKAAVYQHKNVAKSDRILDKSLYNRVNRLILGDRAFNKPDGLWDGANYNQRKSNLKSLSDGAYKVLSEIFKDNDYISSSYGSPNDREWRKAAKTGSYDFIDNIWDESLWLHSDVKEFNIISVEKNKITQIININRDSGKSQYDINSVSTYNYSSNNEFVEEKIQYYKNNMPYGNPELRRYKINDFD